MQQTNSSQQNSGKTNYFRWAGIGIEFCGVLAVFCYMGYKLDESLGTGPWLLVTGFFVGFVGMLYIIIKQAWNIERK